MTARPQVPAYAFPVTAEGSPRSDSANVVISPARETKIAPLFVAPESGPGTGTIRLIAPGGYEFELTGEWADLRGFADALREHVRAESRRAQTESTPDPDALDTAVDAETVGE